jgi:hypothetical protein
MSRASTRLRFIEPQLPTLVDQPPEGTEKHKGYRAMLILEAWLTLRDIRLLVAVVADLVAVVALIIGANGLATMLFIFAAALTLYSLLDWLTLDHKP